MIQYESQKMYGVVENFTNHGLVSVGDEIIEKPIDFIESLLASEDIDLIMVALDKFKTSITFVNTKEEAEKMRNFRLKNLIKSKMEH